MTCGEYAVARQAAQQNALIDELQDTAVQPDGEATAGEVAADRVAAAGQPDQPVGDAYLLSRILHDWNDEDASRILRRCRAAMPAPLGCSSSRRCCRTALATARQPFGWT
jgi:O-methyltransferase domain